MQSEERGIGWGTENLLNVSGVEERAFITVVFNGIN